MVKKVKISEKDNLIILDEAHRTFEFINNANDIIDKKSINIVTFYFVFVTFIITFFINKTVNLSKLDTNLIFLSFCFVILFLVFLIILFILYLKKKSFKSNPREKEIIEKYDDDFLLNLNKEYGKINDENLKLISKKENLLNWIIFITYISIFILTIISIYIIGFLK